MKPRIVVLTGAGISAESGISTFRDSDGLWENYPVQQVASIEGFIENPQLVLDFYNARRKAFFSTRPNSAHNYLSALEKDFEVSIITQNIDNLHEQAGSKRVIHLHGEILKNRSVKDSRTTYEIDRNNFELKVGDLAPDGSQLRPFIVWFGEEVPQMIPAIEEVEKADIFIVIGTSLNVYPAASLLHYLPSHVPVFLIDPQNVSSPYAKNVRHIQEKATTGVLVLDRELKAFLEK